MKKNLIFVTYDGIDHSVFEGQVIKPLLKKKEAYQGITILSFENKQPSKRTITKKIPPEFSCIILKKYPFVTKVSLIPAIRQLRMLLKTYNNFDLIARGPIAGYICYKAKNETQSLTVQARGLLAEEYGYIHKNTTTFSYIIHMIRKWLYFDLEKSIYNKKDIVIESVSTALNDYLIKTYKADNNIMQLATADIPAPIEKKQLQTWKTAVRDELHIPDNAHVYCYSGSVFSWQCPEDVALFFTRKLKEEKNIFLLVLTQNKKEFNTILQKTGIKKKYYKVLSVDHNDVYKYLAACNTGILFRKPHIVSWVSRPVKVMEYKATGLEIVHNNTVELLCEKQLNK